MRTLPGPALRIASLAAALIAVGTAAAADSPQEIVRHVQASSGQKAAAGPFILSGTLGEPIAGPFVAAGQHQVASGFWQEFTAANVGVSQADRDGWVLESSERRSRGRRTNSGGSTLLVGDDSRNRQYRAVLSFDTSSLPDDALVLSAVLQLKYAGIKGSDPFRTHRGLLVDVRSGSFSDNDALQATDFQAKAGTAAAGTVGRTPAGGWYSGVLSAAALPAVNTAGLTQLRLRFKRDDNNDRGADYISFFSGNTAPADRPVLVVEYAVP